MIEIHVIPKWKEYMQSKTARREGDSKKEPRTDTMWKKMLRDVREFYRILFRLRFHHLEFRDADGASRWVKTLFKELGIPCKKEYYVNSKLFWYLHQTHKDTAAKMFKRDQSFYHFSPFEIVENYNENHLKKHMKDYLWSRMFYFVYANCSKYLHYYTLIKKEYREQLYTMICCLMNCYRRMKRYSHIDRIDFWIY